MLKAVSGWILILFGVFASGAVCATSGPETLRVIHLPLYATKVDSVRARLDLAAENGFNVVILAFSDGVRFSTYPAKVRKDAWDVSDLQGVIAYAKKKGFLVVPEIKFTTHQEKFLKVGNADLMFNSVTANPISERVRAIQLAHINEVIEVVGAHAIHIGHDEVAGFSKASRKKWLESDEPTLPAELFEESVKWLHKELTTRGIEVWMWGDMLVAPDEFPGMYERHLHGLPPGYGKPLRDRLPKDIVICDWHYFDEQAEFPTVSVLRKEGFRVLGSTWKRTETTRNFAAYAAAHGAQGMIATTWFHVQRKEWDVVDRIIRESGAIFAEHFPDQKN